MTHPAEQTASAARCIWVFHRGALGDSVLLWPRLREWTRGGSRVVLVTEGAKARLAERETGVEGMDVEQPRFHQLWRTDGKIEPERDVQLVADQVSGGASVFASNLARMFPGALIERGSPPRGGRDAARWMIEHPLSEVEPRPNDDGPVVIHVGAGSRAKRWPPERWASLVTRLRGGRGLEVAVLAGEVEDEQLDAPERRTFAAMGGRFVDDLADLAGAVRRARLFIGCDSGPTHLAAQLGVRTLALFGPTDPTIWAPIGPAVRTVFPADARAMEWLDVDTVVREAEVLLSEELGADRARGPRDGRSSPS